MAKFKELFTETDSMGTSRKKLKKTAIDLQHLLSDFESVFQRAISMDDLDGKTEARIGSNLGEMTRALKDILASTKKF